MGRVIRALFGALIVGLLAGGGYWAYRQWVVTRAVPAGGVSTQVVTVRPGNLNSTVTVVGQLAAVQSADLAFDRMSGAARLVSLTVKPGNTDRKSVV